MKSMTGYGEASQNVSGAKVTVQIRSLNHRHLDLQLRVPREYLSFEEMIRKAVREKIARGRIDLFINRYGTKPQGKKLEINDGLVGQYIASLKQLKRKYRLAGELGLSSLTQVPELFHIREVEADHVGERDAVLKALGSALTKLERSREREGRQLRVDMESQISHMKQVAHELESWAEAVVRAQKDATVQAQNGAIRERDPNETASPVGKGDINEEIVRLKAHVAELAKVTREHEPVGKKIDFMLQEVNRELNTISSKVPNLPVIQLVLRGKERVEKIREQTQNIE
ncbi:MAG TPA: YicC/YloC family endoribonuclease [Phototrophicaceae bacterium]|nr:YicC/YloC family endoribonuclease [Phototrophicaceae bacterium]